MITEKQMKSLPPKDFEPVVRWKHVKLEGGKVKRIAIEVLEYNPQTRKKEVKMKRGSYSASELPKHPLHGVKPW